MLTPLYPPFPASSQSYFSLLPLQALCDKRRRVLFFYYTCVCVSMCLLLRTYAVHTDGDRKEQGGKQKKGMSAIFRFTSLVY